MFWVTVNYDDDGKPTKYNVVKGKHMPVYRDENREVYNGPFDDYGDAAAERDSATFWNVEHVTPS
jgi:hypothetical protein